MKKVISLLVSAFLVLGIAFCTVGCGGSGGSAGEANVDVTFPLKESVTLKLMVMGTEDSSFKSQIENNGLWKRMKKETNVNVEFQFLGTEPSEKLTLLINSGNYGDAIVGGPVLNYISASRYIASGIFKDLTPFVNEEYMPNVSQKLKEKPEIIGMISGADGKIYTLPYIYSFPGNSIESPIWMNGKWLSKLGLSAPKTIDEFTNVLRAFRDNDPNGNGIQDEIPYLVSVNREFYSLEALYGCWGMAFKNGNLDGFCQVVNGKVRFGPILDEYKEAVKYQAMLFDEGLMWNECFTASSSTGLSKLTADPCLVGCFTSNTVPLSSYHDDYICIDPPKVEGYEQAWYNNPSIVASKDRFYVTNKCKYTAILLKWMDYFYNFENAFEVEYGSESDGRYTVENGVYTIRDDLTTEQLNKIDKEHPTLLDLVDRFPHALTLEDYQNKIKDSSLKDQATAYDTYKKWAEKEIWPRPYFSKEDANTIYKLTTDIFYQVTTYRAKWITGKSDIDKEWDEYLSTLKNLKVDDMIKIMQNGYDAYLKNLEEATK